MKKQSEQTLDNLNLQNKYAGREGLIYVRVSSKKQEIEGHGRETQEERCRQYLRSMGIDGDEVKIFPDTFTGGGDFIKRPAMRELFAYVDANPQKKFVVVFDDLKRFARDTTFHLKLRMEFRTRDILPHCLNYNFDDSPEGMFVETVLAAGNELERHQNRRQVVQKMEARLKLGYYCFGHKRGYDLVKDPIHGKILTPNKDAHILKEALEGFASGTFVRQIDVARFLFSKNFWTSRTAEEHLKDTCKILRDPTYCGDIEYAPWDVSRRPGKHTAIISIETYERIQKRLKRDNPKARIRQDISPEFPLRGLIICPACKEKLTAAQCRSSTKKLFAYYYCVTKGCPMRSKSIRKDELENEFRNLIERNGLKAEMLPALELTFNRVWREEAQDYKAKQAAKAKKRSDREQEIRELTDLARQSRSDIVRTQYEHRIEELAKELEDEQNMEKDSDINIPFRTAFYKATALLKNPIIIWDSVDTTEKHQLFFFLFNDRLSYSKIEAFRTADSLCTTRIFEEFCDKNSPDVDIMSKTSNYLKIYLSRFWQYYETSLILKRILEVS